MAVEELEWNSETTDGPVCDVVVGGVKPSVPLEGPTVWCGDDDLHVAVYV